MRNPMMTLVLGALLGALACQKEPPGHASTAASASEAMDNALPELTSGEIHGRLEVSAAVKDKVAAGDVIFVMARNAATGSLIAVTRVDAPEAFPISFTLTGDNIMHTRTALAGKVKLEARVDKDRDAMSKNPGDVIGELGELVQVPAHDVVVTLERVL